MEVVDVETVDVVEADVVEVEVVTTEVVEVVDTSNVSIRLADIVFEKLAYTLTCPSAVPHM